MVKIRSIIMLFGLAVHGSHLNAGSGFSKCVERGENVPIAEKAIVIATLAAAGTLVYRTWASQSSQNQNFNNQNNNQFSSSSNSASGQLQSNQPNNNNNFSLAACATSIQQYFQDPGQSAQGRKHSAISALNVRNYGINRIIGSFGSSASAQASAADSSDVE